MNEQKTAGANYILTFYNDVQQLNNTTAQYLNLVMDIKQKYSLDSVQAGKMSDTEKMQFSEACQTFRFFATRAYIGITSIHKALKEETPEAITKGYEIARKEFSPSQDQVMDYTTAVNAVLMKDVIKALLDNAQEFVNTLYGQPNTNNA